MKVEINVNLEQIKLLMEMVNNEGFKDKKSEKELNGFTADIVIQVIQQIRSKIKNIMDSL